MHHANIPASCSTQPSEGIRRLETCRNFLLALVVSSGAILVFLYGAGVGSPMASGIFLATTTAALFFLGDWSRFLFNHFDALFALFVICVGLSFANNGLSAGPKEIALLIITLAAYPAGRLMPRGALTPVFAATLALIVSFGTIFTVVALFDQWGDQMSRPVVFGYNHAATAFLVALSFALISLATRELTARKTKIVCAVAALPALVFAISMVRFAFMALIAALLAAATSTYPTKRRYVYAIIATIVAAAVAGSLIRHEHWITLGNYAISNVKALVLATAKPDDRRSECGIIVNDSIGVRAVLWRDAVRTIPAAGYFGFGLNNYKDRACFKSTSPHNAVLQALVEFGWLGGLTLALLIFWTIAASWRPSLSSTEARFVLCCLVFVTCVSMVHGNLSNALLLFLFLGYASRIYEHNRNFCSRTRR